MCFLFYCFVSNYIEFNFVSYFKYCLLNVVRVKSFSYFKYCVVNCYCVFTYRYFIFLFILLYCIFVIFLLGLGPSPRRGLIWALFHLLFESNKPNCQQQAQRSPNKANRLIAKPNGYLFLLPRVAHLHAARLDLAFNFFSCEPAPSSFPRNHVVGMMSLA